MNQDESAPQDSGRTVSSDAVRPLDLSKSAPSTTPIPVVAAPRAPAAPLGPSVVPPGQSTVSLGQSVVPSSAYPPGPPAGHAPAVTTWSGTHWGPATDQRPVNAALVVVAWVIAVFTFAYMLPWAIAASRGRSNQAAIGVLNLFLGWSFIGWVVALVMACQAHAPRMVAPVNVMVAAPYPAPPVAGPPAGWYPSPAGNGQEYWDGRAWTGHRTA